MIYIVTHKRVDLPKLKGYRAIQVGGASDSFPGCLRDDTGDNIADKNGLMEVLMEMYAETLSTLTDSNDGEGNATWAKVE